MLNISIMRKVFISMVAIGVIMGLIFPLFIREFIVINIDIKFRTACVLAGFIVGLLNYYLIKRILENHLAPVITTAQEIACGQYNLKILCKPLKNDILYDLYNAIINMSCSLQCTHQQLERQAIIDSLTNVYNRLYYNSKIDGILGYARCKNQSIALLYIDLDNFKVINDVHGHSVGDQVLVEIAQRLKAFVNCHEVVARMGGDEFTIVLYKPIETSIETRVQEIVNIICEPIVITNMVLNVTASIGVSIFPEHGLDPQTLLRNADLAMYRAKQSSSSYCFVDYDQNLLVETRDKF